MIALKVNARPFRARRGADDRAYGRANSSRDEPGSESEAYQDRDEGAQQRTYARLAHAWNV